MSESLAVLRQVEYDLRLQVNRLQREIAEQADAVAAVERLEELLTAQRELKEAEEARATAEGKQEKAGVITHAQTRQPGSATRGAQTTGLDVKVQLRMAQAPTAIYHLFDRAEHPLVTYTIKNTSTTTRRVRIISYIDGYSAHVVDTVEMTKGKPYEGQQLPTLFPERIHSINELTRATFNFLVEDLDGKVELHETAPIWLLSRNSAPLAVRDPTTGGWNDLTRYFGAFVTPNEASVMNFLRTVAHRHPDKRLVGYQGNVELQVKAAFEALKTDANVTYVNSVIDFSPEEGARTQRVRLPRQSLDEKQANCIDGTLLFASLLEAMSLNPAIVVVPKHVFLGWETEKAGSDQWKYLETTMIGTNTFEESVEAGERKAKVYETQYAATQDAAWFRRWSIRDLRTEYDITPME